MDTAVETLLNNVRQAICGTPFQGNLYLVGGAVRDELLGIRNNNDLDFVTTHDSGVLARLLFESGIGTDYPTLFPKFQTSMLEVGAIRLEFVTARKESYSANSRKPEVAAGTLMEDAMRRDFTANALMKSVSTCEILDLTGKGLQDIKDKILRTPQSAEVAFADDPLRMLRTIRFQFQLGFEPAPGLYQSIKNQAHRLKVISEERIRDEFLKMLSRPTASKAMRALLETELLLQFVPELVELVGVEQGRFHHLDVWDHTLLALDVLFESFQPTEKAVLAVLFHDIGKPATRFVDDEGNTRFFGHESLGAKVSMEILLRLKLPSDEARAVAKLVGAHMRLGSSPSFSDAAARRLIRDLAEDLNDFFQVVGADTMALKPGVKVMDLASIRRKVFEISAQTPIEKLKSPLSGGEIMQIFNIAGGPRVGEIKNWLIERVLEGELLPDDKDLAIRLLSLYLSQPSSAE